MDIFDNGTPKYQSPSMIYDGLCDLVQSEEISILSEIFPDVSWERQGYHYQVEGDRLKYKFEELTSHCDKMWTMAVAVWQIDQDEVHGLIFEALCNSDFAKRIGLKKLFVEHMLKGSDTQYKEIIAAYEDEVRELNRFDNHEMVKAFVRVMENYGQSFEYVTPYPLYNSFAYHFCEKLRRMNVQAEAALVAECRSLLTSYDDLMFGLKVNQALHEGLEGAFKMRTKELTAEYDEKTNALLALAAKHGLLEDFQRDVLLLSPPAIPVLDVGIITTNE